MILQSFPSQSSFSEHFNQQEVFQEKKKWWKLALIFPFGTEDKQTVNNLIMTSELVFAERPLSWGQYMTILEVIIHLPLPYLIFVIFFYTGKIFGE